MAYLILNGKNYSITNFNKLGERCTCTESYFTKIENPIRIILREGKEPTVFKSTTNEPILRSQKAISFKGCICELEKISESYKIYGAKKPTQYNWGTEEVSKELENIILHSDVPSKTIIKWMS